MNDIEKNLSQILNFQFIHAHLFTSGQPTQVELQSIKAYGVSTIINLGLTEENTTNRQEEHDCLALGLHYIHMPISWEMPSDDQCILVLDLIHHLVQDQILWIHCQNNYRVSSLMYLYLHYYLNIEMPTAQQQMHQVWQPNQTWTGLIHAVALQLQGRKATKELQDTLMHTSLTSHSE
ncbi:MULTISPECIES: hypothetical protein [unclassified Acinetobacter]|uniref:hypothetical protein n=1 Tax=unclassified Acinetobacter TaxID=196816 RepID=UPI0029341B4A|nr:MULTISPECIES: hypothetical protein [unclassified Acinetobacter]WOE32328.1 hypothetical protein QSG84_03720 [Acinetobacter sp. SAAs470]WOE37801.1 hypothetical protein QSG86_12770 [Acinetobacter sp. SAAs474]